MAAPEGNQYWRLRESHGRELEYSNPEELLSEIVRYFEWCDQHPWNRNEAIKSGDKVGTTVAVPTARPYTISGLCIHLGISFKTWKEYGKRQDFLHIITRAEEIIETQQFEGAAVGAFNANIIARKLGLSDKSELVGKGDTELFKDKTDDELKMLLKDLSSKLNDGEG
jgi:hypothetical protein